MVSRRTSLKERETLETLKENTEGEGRRRKRMEER
jgi:hypothetical protein